MFLIDRTGPTGARPMSRLRRPLLPVTSSSFTAPEVHSRSWRSGGGAAAASCAVGLAQRAVKFDTRFG